jgi:hypothetical protein
VHIDTSQIEGLGTAGTPVGGVMSVQFVEPLTYSAAATFVSATAPTDIFLVTGSATKIIRIHKVKITATTTSGSAIKVNFQLLKRSTANVGGVVVVDTSVQHDSLDAAATAVVRHYTANPTTLGTLAGIIRADSNSVSPTGVGGGAIEWVFNEAAFKPIVLRGVNESLAVNLGSTSITGSMISISAEWSEV